MTSLNSYSAQDDRITIMGRYQPENDGSVLFGASGVSFYIRFEGSELEVDLIDEFRYGTSYNIFTVILNGVESHRFKTIPGKSRYTLATDLPHGIHDVILMKATEGANGWSRLTKVHTANLLKAPELPGLRIEFIGDSITCGMAADEREISCGQGEWMDQHNTWSSYGAIVARGLDTQFMLTAVSGMGMHRNWNTPYPVMPDRFQSVFADPADSISRWDFGRYQPDVVIVALGTNDFSDGDKPDPRPAPVADEFKSQYYQFLVTLRENYPNTEILLLNSPLIDNHRNEILTSWLHELKSDRAASGDHKIHIFEFTEQFQSGCSGHPDIAEHQRMADLLIPVVSNIISSR